LAARKRQYKETQMHISGGLETNYKETDWHLLETRKSLPRRAGGHTVFDGEMHVTKEWNPRNDHGAASI
jgi:hypothetical protein